VILFAIFDKVKFNVLTPSEENELEMMKSPEAAVLNFYKHTNTGVRKQFSKVRKHY
jgi:hypothetical protein